MSFSTRNKKTVNYVTEERFNEVIKNITQNQINGKYLNNCTIKNPKSIQFIKYENLEEANSSIQDNKLGELIYIENEKNLYQVDENINGLFYNKLIKSEEFGFYFAAKCTDISGQVFYNEKEQNILFTDIELDNHNAVDLSKSEILIKYSGLYSLNANFIIESIKNKDYIEKFGFYLDDKFIDITNCFLKSDGIGYLSGNFEGYLKKDTKIKLILKLKCNDFLYLSNKPGVNYISLRSLKLGKFND